MIASQRPRQLPSSGIFQSGRSSLGRSPGNFWKLAKKLQGDMSASFPGWRLTRMFSGSSLRFVQATFSFGWGRVMILKSAKGGWVILGEGMVHVENIGAERGTTNPMAVP
jgi:hypothetical protein